MSILIKTIGLALVDAVNPCALAIMTIVLITLLTQNTKNRKNVLFGGLAFTLAVFILYFLYGWIMIQFFSHLIPETGNYAIYIFKGFGLFAIILGILNIKDYYFYKPGGLATEMPLSMRPKMKLLIKKITSPKGAFLTGIFITIFLLPCTIGPYVVFSGEISESALGFLTTSFWLLIYNFIFVLPMIGITFAIYFGLTTVDNVSGWKERNIKLLHLIEGLLLITLGILMFTGII